MPAQFYRPHSPTTMPAQFNRLHSPTIIPAQFHRPHSSTTIPAQFHWPVSTILLEQRKTVLVLTVLPPIPPFSLRNHNHSLLSCSYGFQVLAISKVVKIGFGLRNCCCILWMSMGESFKKIGGDLSTMTTSSLTKESNSVRNCQFSTNYFSKIRWTMNVLNQSTLRNQLRYWGIYIVVLKDMKSIQENMIGWPTELSIHLPVW